MSTQFSLKLSSSAPTMWELPVLTCYFNNKPDTGFCHEYLSLVGGWGGLGGRKESFIPIVRSKAMQ